MSDIKMTYTKDEFFMAFAPNFNFEYNPDQIVEICLEHNLIKKNKLITNNSEADPSVKAYKEAWKGVIQSEKVKNQKKTPP